MHKSSYVLTGFVHIPSAQSAQMPWNIAAAFHFLLNLIGNSVHSRALLTNWSTTPGKNTQVAKTVIAATRKQTFLQQDAIWGIQLLC